jgi:hypothetical protein
MGSTDETSLPADQRWDWESRHETREQRLDRNFSEMLQELRVAQTGVQILFAFLLTAAFANGFREVKGAGLVVYCAAVVASALATCFLIAPVACHRLMFRHRAKGQLVQLSHQYTLIGLTLLVISVICSLLLVLEVTIGWGWAVTITLVVAATYVVSWAAMPLRYLERERS